MHHDETIEAFLDAGDIAGVIRPIKSGKEASVYLCRANGSTRGPELLAAKVYRPRDHRAFRNDAAYKAGRVFTEGRDRRAVQRRSSFGRGLEEALWIDHEYEVLRTLHASGADVPEPIVMRERGILMEYVGDERDPAPQLRQVRLDPGEAAAAFERLIWNVELALSHNVIHADLSPFNVLWWEGRMTIIDFPQAVDPRSNRNAQGLLARDVEHVCAHFRKAGVPADPEAILRDLWVRFLFAEL
ncbi:MAG TPA: RIO1 family regulatory kinase/ATPase [Actinomycetota bacterium]